MSARRRANALALFELDAGAPVCRPARRAYHRRSIPADPDAAAATDGLVGVNLVAGEWRYMVLVRGRVETGEAESARDAWADALQVARNIRGY